MKLVANMIYSREIEFSFWVRMIPVRGSPPSQTEVYTRSDALGQLARAPLTAHFVHFLHIVAITFGKGKGFLLFFQSFYCHREAENQHWSDDINSSKTNFCWVWSPNTDDTGESSSSLLVLKQQSTHSPDLLAVRCFKTMY